MVEFNSLNNIGLDAQPKNVFRTILHPQQICFLHPSRGEKVCLTALYPDDFRDANSKLKTATTPDATIL